MSFVTMILASAGLSLSMMGPGSCPPGCEKDCCTAEAAPEKEAHCPLCATKDAKQPELPQIDTAAYGNANWPAHNPEKGLYFKNFQGKPMPAKFSDETVLSGERTLEHTKGKVMIVDFWATWCGPCVAAAPKLAELQEANKDNLQVVGVSGVNEDQATVAAFLASHEEPFVQLFDSDQKVMKHFETRGIPLVLVVSTDGVIRWMGNPLQPEFKKVVEQVLEADPLIQAKS